jgi:predicted nucleotide-binding protein
MAKPKLKPAKAASTPKKERTYLSQSDVPWHSVDKALTVAEAIVNHYGSKPTKPSDVAAALDVQPTSSNFKMLTGASIAYGLTEGGWNAPKITLTPLALKIIKYKTDTDTLDGKREALLKPRVIREFLNQYNDSAIPREDIAKNVLEGMGVPKDRTATVLSLIREGAEAVGFVTEIKGKKHVDLQGVTPPTEPSTEDEQEELPADVPDGVPGKPAPQPAITPKPGTDTRLPRVFISHGKNRVFIDPIKQLLEMVQLQAVVSVESSTVSQPITQKVMNDMRSCGAAIIHVDSEQKLIDPADTKEVVVLNSNVMIEIGAAMALYGERYILLVRDGVKLPSNLQGLYEVRYKGDKLDSDETIALLKSIHDMKTKTLPS